MSSNFTRLFVEEKENEKDEMIKALEAQLLRVRVEKDHEYRKLQDRNNDSVHNETCQFSDF